MIKFFRKIRQQLLTENKLSKYLLYAIGEILLVVLGIMIALSINNQNQERQEREREKEFINGLVDDFQETKALLENNIRKQEMVLSRGKKLNNILENKDYTVSSDSIIQLLTTGGYTYFTAEAVLSTYDAIIGSGDISILQDKKLINSLSKFSSKFNKGFDDNALSEEFALLMTKSIAEFASVLEFEGNRQELEATYRPSEKEKKVAIQKLFNTPSFLTFLKWKIRIEANRLRWQKELLADVKIVLIFLEGKMPPMTEEYLKKFVGNYRAKADSIPIKFNILLEDGQLYFNSPMVKSKLIPYAIDIFYSQTPNIKFNFDFDENGFAGLKGISSTDSIQFIKVENK